MKDTIEHDCDKLIGDLNMEKGFETKRTKKIDIS